jgi:hypothetical protein
MCPRSDHHTCCSVCVLYIHRLWLFASNVPLLTPYGPPPCRSAEDKAPNGEYIQYEDKVDHPGRRIDWGPWAVCRWVGLPSAGRVFIGRSCNDLTTAGVDASTFVAPRTIAHGLL